MNSLISVWPRRETPLEIMGLFVAKITGYKMYTLNFGHYVRYIIKSYRNWNGHREDAIASFVSSDVLSVLSFFDAVSNLMLSGESRI